ncbi:MAG: hypothetical protein MIO92_06865 [Methanosarcinaceae archaeon]|nr:hypothetical protein [Methanosarcinaceae archaeon]
MKKGRKVLSFIVASIFMASMLVFSTELFSRELLIPPNNPALFGSDLSSLLDNPDLISFSASVDPTRGDMFIHPGVEHHCDKVRVVFSRRSGDQWEVRFYQDWRRSAGILEEREKELIRAISKYADPKFLKGYFKNLITNKKNKVNARHLFTKYVRDESGQMRYMRRIIKVSTQKKSNVEHIGVIAENGLVEQAPTDPPKPLTTGPREPNPPTDEPQPPSEETPPPASPEIDAHADRNPEPAKPPGSSRQSSKPKAELPDMTKKTKVKNPELLKRYERVAKRVFGSEYPNLRGLKNNGVIPRPAEVMPEYTQSVENELINHEALIKKYEQKKSALLRHHVKQHVRREARAVRKTFAEYKRSLSIQQRKDIARVRKLAEQSRGNSALTKFLAELIAMDLIVSFTRGYYDGGWPQVKEMLKETTFITAAFTGVSLAIMNIPTGAEIVWAASPYLGPFTESLFLTLAVKGIAMNTTYMAVDYFVLDENRKTLVKVLYPKKRVNVFDFWSFYAEVYRQDLTPETLYFISDRWQGLENLDVNIQDHLTKAVEILVNRYRKWLLDKHPETRKLEYFKDDQKLWNDLATIIRDDLRISLIMRELVESRKINVDVMTKDEEKELEEDHLAVAGEDRVVGGFLGDIIASRDVRKGAPITVDFECIFYGLPKERLEPTVQIRLLNKRDEVQGEKVITKNFEVSEEKAFVTFEISETLPSVDPGDYKLEVVLAHQDEQIERKLIEIRVQGEETRDQSDEASLNRLDHLVREIEGLSADIVRLCAIVQSGVPTIGSDLIHLESELSGLERGLIPTSDVVSSTAMLKGRLEELHNNAENTAAKVGEKGNELERLSVQICEEAKQIKDAGPASERQQLLAGLQGKKSEIRSRLSEANTEFKAGEAAERSAKEIAARITDAEAQFKQFPDITRLSGRLGSARDLITRIRDGVDKASQKRSELENTKTEAESLLEKLFELVRKLGDSEEAKRMNEELDNYETRIAKAVADAPNCVATTPLDKYSTQIADLETRISSLLANREVCTAAFGAGGSATGIRQKVEMIEYVISLAKSYLERCNNAAADGAFCLTLAEDLSNQEVKEQVEGGGFTSLGDETQPGSQRIGLEDETVTGGFESLGDETRPGRDKPQELDKSEDEDQGGFRSEGEGETRPGRERPREIVKPEQVRNGHCHELEGLFWAAIDTENLTHARLILEEAKACPFYGRAMGILQDREHLLCMKFESAVLAACLDQDPEQAQGLLQEARSWGCLISQNTYNIIQEQMAFRQRQQAQSELARNRMQGWNQFWNGLQMWQSELMQGMQPPPDVDRYEKQPPIITRRPPLTSEGFKGMQPPPYVNRYEKQPPVTTRKPPLTKEGLKEKSVARDKPKAGMSYDACLKKFCPMCAKAISLLDVSADPKCNECKKRNKAKIENCVRGK